MKIEFVFRTELNDGEITQIREMIEDDLGIEIAQININETIKMENEE